MKKVKYFIVPFLVSVLMVTGCDNKQDNKQNNQDNSTTTKVKNEEVALATNALGDFDLSFLKLENEKKNKIYSPISIKYALKMLEEAANGETKEQIEKYLKDYNVTKYTNSNNLSFANAFFVKNDFKDSINASYEDTLLQKYNASIVSGTFETPNIVNDFVSKKTLGLINNLVDDISDKDFILINALAIDMEWVKKINEFGLYVMYNHEKFSKFVDAFDSVGYRKLDFEGLEKAVNSIEIGAVINKYDIVNELGEENIRKTVGEEYSKWLQDPNRMSCYYDNSDPDVDTYLDSYIDEINQNYKRFSSSTDFYFYDDDNIKGFAKDLKEYDGITLEYVAVMPKNNSLDKFIDSLDAKVLSSIIDSFKPVTLDTFKDGVISVISGYIPVFKFDYSLKIMDDLQKIGITNIFDSGKADLSNMTSSNAFISTMIHKSNIEFSNEGIKAAAVTLGGGMGAGDCGFYYDFEVPVEEIDLTFDKPYLFLIRDKQTGEVWFIGTVYEPTEWTPISYNY